MNILVCYIIVIIHNIFLHSFLIFKTLSCCSIKDPIELKRPLWSHRQDDRLLLAVFIPFWMQSQGRGPAGALEIKCSECTLKANACVLFFPPSHFAFLCDHHGYILQWILRAVGISAPSFLWGMNRSMWHGLTWALNVQSGCYEGNKLISECYLWVAEQGALPGLFVPVPLRLNVNDGRHKNRQGSWFKLDLDMDIGALCACVHEYIVCAYTECGYACAWLCLHWFI